MLEPADENIIIYIPVDAATVGGTPMLIKSGLKIAPPPKPKAPETSPPIKAKDRSFSKVLLLYLRSLSTSPIPILIFKFYSLFMILTDTQVSIQQRRIKLYSTTQSTVLHFYTPK